MEPVEFLSHYGVKGMKWGVRKDRRGGSKGARSSRTTYKKAPVRLSDSELNRRIKRMELEKKYTDLNTPPPKKGRSYAMSLLENSGKTAVGAVVGGAASFMIQKILKEKFNTPVDPRKKIKLKPGDSFS